MTNKGGKWPFDGDDKASAKDDAKRNAEQEQARKAAEALNKQRLRHDRLLVGGRAHTKKPGLS